MAERVVTGRHVLIGMIVFFGVIFAANGAFLYSAISTYTGVVSNEPYRKGLNYNERIAADRAQHELGWTSDVSFAKSGDGLDIVMKDRAGNPVTGLVFEGRLGRPATEAMDIVLVVKESTPGLYRATFDTVTPGAWQVDVTAKELHTEGEKVVWRDRRRIRWQTP